MLGIKDYAEIIVTKKNNRGSLYDRTTSEMGETAVDILLEKMNKDRFWSRGRFHYDFKSRTGDYRLEVKTRKFYTHNFEDLDVRLDFWEYDAAKEATHLIPVVFSEIPGGAAVISPGALLLDDFVKGTIIHKDIIPKTLTLKHGCFRAPWGVVWEYPEDFGYQPWDEFLKEFK